MTSCFAFVAMALLARRDNGRNRKEGKSEEGKNKAKEGDKDLGQEATRKAMTLGEEQRQQWEMPQ